MTLFHLDSERGLRGGERQLLYLASKMRELGHENVVVCRGGSALELEARRIQFKTLTLPFLAEWDPISAWLLRRAAASSQPPVIFHAHTAHTAAIAYLASRLGGPSVIAHRRVDFPLNGALSRWLKYDSADRVVAVSRSVRDVLVRCGVAERRIAVVHDCLPQGHAEARAAGMANPLKPPTPEERAAARRLLAKAWNLPEEIPWIANIAALVPHKDQETLLRSAPLILARRAVCLLLIGDGPLKGQLESLARDLALAESVRFIGFEEDLRPWLKALDLLVHSSWGEGMGSVLLEAMACRLPIVATSAGGIPEVLTHPQTALLTPPRDPGALGEAVLQALENTEASRLRAEAAAQTLETFSLSRCGQTMARLYAEVAS